MKDIHEVLRQKQAKYAQLGKQIEMLQQAAEISLRKRFSRLFLVPAQTIDETHDAGERGAWKELGGSDKESVLQTRDRD